MNLRKVIFWALCFLFLAGCSVTKSLKDGEYLLRKNSVVVNDPSFSAASLSSYIAQKPNSYILGVNPLLSVYNWGKNGETGFQRFLQSIGDAPVVYDPSMVDKSIGNIQNHLRYVGYYGSQVESRVNVSGRMVYVTYYVALGRRYEISAIDYQVPGYGTFQQDFAEDLPNSTLAPGQFLSESSLEQEAARSAQAFRNKGYYGFTKSYYAFEADTTLAPGKARLKMFIRDYALGDAPSSAREHKKFTLGQVTVTHPEKLKIRTSVLENLNTLRPGSLYNEKDINTAYSRLSNIEMLSGINMNMTPVSDQVVDCDIRLRNSRLQSVKADLEASVNSTGFFGISPQLNYYHKNIFHGGERLNVGLKGNFQFKPGNSVFATEMSLTTSIRFPKFVGLHNRLFKGTYLPTTDVSLAFSYQDRPEFRRSLISSAFSYNGRLGKRFFYQITPIKANIAHLFSIDEDFLSKIIVSNPFLLSAYTDHFDMGVGGTFYYTTDAATVPTTAYHYARLGVNVSGNVISLFNKLMPLNDVGQRTIWGTPYAQYVKAELNLGKVFRFGKDEQHALALHFVSGAAIGYGNSFSAPIEQLFYAGGSMSMRGWQARTLGPGNASMYQLFSIPTQIGEMKLEANAEYRFPLSKKLEGALFVDAGNIWDLNDADADEDANAQFRWNKLGESLGLDWGLGIRLNLNMILIRVDGGIRLHDPARTAGNRWVPVNEWLKGNYAIHFGVGYPF